VFIRLQTASAVLLLVLASVFGQAGIRQCLCTGQVSYVSNFVEKCEDCCCKKHGENPPHEELPSPCDDGSCYWLIALFAVDPIATPATTSAPVATFPPSIAKLDLLAPHFFVEPQFPRQRPPDRKAVPLTVLFSSFLI